MNRDDAKKMLADERWARSQFGVMTEKHYLPEQADLLVKAAKKLFPDEHAHAYDHDNKGTFTISVGLSRGFPVTFARELGIDHDSMRDATLHHSKSHSAAHEPKGDGSHADKHPKGSQKGSGHGHGRH